MRLYTFLNIEQCCYCIQDPYLQQKKREIEIRTIFFFDNLPQRIKTLLLLFFVYDCNKISWLKAISVLYFTKAQHIFLHCEGFLFYCQQKLVEKFLTTIIIKYLWFNFTLSKFSLPKKKKSICGHWNRKLSSNFVSLTPAIMTPLKLKLKLLIWETNAQTSRMKIGYKKWQKYEYDKKKTQYYRFL